MEFSTDIVAEYWPIEIWWVYCATSEMRRPSFLFIWEFEENCWQRPIINGRSVSNRESCTTIGDSPGANLIHTGTETPIFVLKFYFVKKLASSDIWIFTLKKCSFNRIYGQKNDALPQCATTRFGPSNCAMLNLQIQFLTFMMMLLKLNLLLWSKANWRSWNVLLMMTNLTSTHLNRSS